MNPELEIQRGELARQVLENPILKETFDTYEKHLFEMFANSRYKDSEDRDEIWRKLQAFRTVKGELEQILETGQLAKRGLLQQTKKVVGL